MNFEEMCLPLRGEMVNYARRLAHSTERAEDVVQDAYVRAWRAWARWSPTEGMEPQVCARAWLYKIVLNTFANEHHKRKRENATLSQTDAVVAGMHDLEEPHDQSISDEVESALSVLIPQFRETAERYYFQEQSCEQIAREMGVRLGTVLSRLSRARDILIPRLTPYAREQWGLRAVVDSALGKAAGTPQEDTRSVKSVVTKLNHCAL